MGLIRVIDMEATGLQLDAKVCEVGHVDLDTETLAIGPGRSYLCRVESMPPDTRAVHHIRAEETWGFPPYDRRCVYEEAARAGVVAFAAHSADFEEKFLLGSIPTFCTYKAALRHWPDAPGHGVFPLLYWLEDQGVQFDQALAFPPHRALPDAYATAVLIRQMLRDGVTGADLFQWTREPRLHPTCPIGDYRGHKWATVPWSMLEWIAYKARDLGDDLRWCARREMGLRDEAARIEHEQKQQAERKTLV